MPWSARIQQEKEDIPGAFNAAPVWGRISVVAAGPIFNFILAFILSVIIVGFMGYDPAEVMEVQEGSPAAEQVSRKEISSQNMTAIMWILQKICTCTVILMNWKKSH